MAPTLADFKCKCLVPSITLSLQTDMQCRLRLGLLPRVWPDHDRPDCPPPPEAHVLVGRLLGRRRLGFLHRFCSR